MKNFNLKINRKVTSSPDFKEVLEKLVSSKFASRLIAKDNYLWGADSASEASIRLGWIDAVDDLPNIVEETKKFNSKINEIGIDRIILCGMGGSTLAAQLLSNSLGGEIISLDTTHPHEIAIAFDYSKLSRTLTIISTKSGNTIETRSQLAFAEKRFKAEGLDLRNHILVITDPGTELEEYAKNKEYTVLNGDENVGGRFSALTHFGVTPALLGGANADGLYSESKKMLKKCSLDSSDNPALRVAAALYLAALKQPVAQFVSDPNIALLPAWIEQLVAESTGKQGNGLLPVPRTENNTTPYAGPTIECILSGQGKSKRKNFMSVTATLGGHILLWEIATVALSFLMGVNPFDQPDVETTKRMAHRFIEEDESKFVKNQLCDSVKIIEDTSIAGLVKNFAPAKYILLQAFIEETSHSASNFRNFANWLETVTKKPVVLSFGPRYLHSTGQMHKGGPGPVLVVQFTYDSVEDYQIPGEHFTFGDLQTSWVYAERLVHQELGNKVVTLIVTDIEKSLTELKKLSVNDLTV